jgi:prepilin-type N-terminal cleavage/methylation domain-containing protein
MAPRRTAFTLPELLVCLAIVGVLLAMIFPTIQRAREAANRLVCHNNLHQIGMALHQYHGQHDVFPSGAQGPGRPYAYLSWRARLLTYLEQTPLAMQAQNAFEQDWRFWAPPHIPIRTTVLPVFICPTEGRAVSQHQKLNAAYAHYLGISGSKPGNGVFYVDSKVRAGDITDGLSYTLMIGERPPSSNERYGWWYAGIGQDNLGTLDAFLAARQFNGSFYAPHLPLGPYEFGPGSSDDLSSMFHFWSSHPGGGNFLAAGGNVHFLRYSAVDVLPALCTRAGKENVSLPVE